ncbi:MAG: hypothetical protein METHAR1v1_740007 [Methanothrix sp.]|nr:MAG: hypothetical protein METHAR1v1_740007 [Methanothrix sp.]
MGGLEASRDRGAGDERLRRIERRPAAEGPDRQGPRPGYEGYAPRRADEQPGHLAPARRDEHSERPGEEEEDDRPDGPPRPQPGVEVFSRDHHDEAGEDHGRGRPRLRPHLREHRGDLQRRGGGPLPVGGALHRPDKADQAERLGPEVRRREVLYFQEEEVQAASVPRRDQGDQAIVIGSLIPSPNGKSLRRGER